ncbi:MAG: hypothetical protein R3B96_15400 [Pirellulaceae bacterium]
MTEDDETFVLRDAEGKTHVIPQEDIDQSVEGGSLMPNGLKVLMTDQEFHDLIAFLSQLGKPGPYVVQQTNRTALEGFGSQATWAHAGRRDDPQWNAIGGAFQYRRLAKRVRQGGRSMPLAEVADTTEDNTLFLKAEIEVVVGGEIRFSWQGRQPPRCTSTINHGPSRSDIHARTGAAPSHDRYLARCLRGRSVG